MFFTEDNASILLKALNSYKHKQVGILVEDRENKELKQVVRSVIEMEDFLRKIQLRNRK